MNYNTPNYHPSDEIFYFKLLNIMKKLFKNYPLELITAGTFIALILAIIWVHKLNNDNPQVSITNHMDAITNRVDTVKVDTLHSEIK